MMSSFTSRLYQSWRQAVANNKVINQFEAAQDDPSGRWVKGDRIVYGVKSIDQQLSYYALNATQNKDIPDAIDYKKLEDTAYLCYLNSYRSLRPGGTHRQIGRQPDIPSEPAACRFQCQNSHHPRSLLQRDPLLSETLTHLTWMAYYNLAPLEPEGHFLWLPTTSSGSSLPHWPQQLTPELIEDAIHLFNQLSNTIIFFNGLHAGASVNHIHFQLMYHRQPLPIELAPTSEYKGYQLIENYPAQAVVFDPKSIEPLVSYIVALQRSHIPFNLVMISNRILVIARDSDHEIVSEIPQNGLASLEMCGLLTLFDRQTFNSITARTYESALQKTVLPAQKIIDNLLFS